jgi:hypothetical protein
MEISLEQINQLVRARIRQIYWQALERFPTEEEVEQMIRECYWQGKELPVIQSACVKGKGKS